MAHAWVMPDWQVQFDVFQNHHPCLPADGPVTDPGDPCWDEATNGPGDQHGCPWDGPTQASPAECEALVAVREANPDAAVELRRWNTDSDPCTWLGVTCGPTGVTEIALSTDSSIGLTSLPSEIGDLTDLRTLNLRINQLTDLPTEIGDLDNLTHLNLAGNQLSSLPATIGNLTNLTGIDVGNNQLTELPQELSDNHPNVFLANNQLSGDISPWAIGYISTVDDPVGTSINGLVDGPGGSNCLTSSDDTVTTWLDTDHPGWDVCE